MLLVVGNAPVDARAQGTAAGVWQCRHANQSMTNNAFENWIYEFQLALSPDGAFQAQGSYTAMTAGFAVGFQAQGGWQQSAQGVAVTGSEWRQDGTSMRFLLLFTNISGSSMSNQYQSAQGRLLTYCQR